MSRKQYEDFDAGVFVHELYGGVYAEQMAQAVKDVASGVDDHKRQGKISLTLKFKPFEGGEGVMIEHELHRDIPEAHGNSVRKIKNKTHMHIGTGGAVSVLSEKQQDFFENMADQEIEGGNVSPIKKENN